MDLEGTLGKIVELSREELDVVRKRAEEKTAARDHGRDFTRCSAPPTDWTATPTSCAACTTQSSARTGGTRA